MTINIGYNRETLDEMTRIAGPEPDKVAAWLLAQAQKQLWLHELMSGSAYEVCGAELSWLTKDDPVIVLTTRPVVRPLLEQRRLI